MDAKKMRIAGACALASAVCWLLNYFAANVAILPKTMQSSTLSLVLVIASAVGIAAFGVALLLQEKGIAALGGLVYVAATAALLYLFIKADLVYYLPQSWLFLAIGMLLYGWVSSSSKKQTKAFMYWLPGLFGLFGFMSYFPWGLQVITYATAQSVLWIGFEGLLAAAMCVATLALRPAPASQPTAGNETEN